MLFLYKLFSQNKNDSLVVTACFFFGNVEWDGYATRRRQRQPATKAERETPADGVFVGKMTG